MCAKRTLFKKMQTKNRVSFLAPPCVRSDSELHHRLRHVSMNAHTTTWTTFFILWQLMFLISTKKNVPHSHHIMTQSTPDDPYVFLWAVSWRRIFWITLQKGAYKYSRMTCYLRGGGVMGSSSAVHPVLSRAHASSRSAFLCALYRVCFGGK